MTDLTKPNCIAMGRMECMLVINRLQLVDSIGRTANLLFICGALWGCDSVSDQHLARSRKHINSVACICGCSWSCRPVLDLAWLLLGDTPCCTLKSQRTLLVSIALVQNAYAAKVCRNHVAHFLGHCYVGEEAATPRLTPGLWLVGTCSLLAQP